MSSAVDRTGLAARFRDHLTASGCLADAGHAVVAVSGGVDSMTLLHLLRFGGTAPSLTLHAAHLDHGMRVESEADAEWLGGVCAAWGVAYRLRTASTPVRTEAEGRELRYRFVAGVAKDFGGAGDPHGSHRRRPGRDRALSDRAGQRSPRSGRHSPGTAAVGSAPPASLPARRGGGVCGRARGSAPRGSHQPGPALDPQPDPSRNPSGAGGRGPGGRGLAGLAGRHEPGGVGRARPAAGRTHRGARSCGSRRRVTGSPFLRPQGARRPPRPAPDRAAPARRRASGRISRPRGHAALVRFAREARVRRSRYARGGRTSRTTSARSTARAVAAARTRDGHRVRGHASPVGGSSSPTRCPCARRAPERSRFATARHVAVSWRSTDGGQAADPPPAPAGRRSVQAEFPGAPSDSPFVAHFAPRDVGFPLDVRPWVPGDRMTLPYGKKKVKKILLEARIPADRRQGWPVVADAGGAILWVPGSPQPSRAVRPSPGDDALRLEVRVRS